MCSSLQSTGRESVSIEYCSKYGSKRPTESSLAQLLRTKFGIESGPTDLEVFKLYRSLTTSFESMTISSIAGTLLDIFGIIESVTFVNTD